MQLTVVKLDLLYLSSDNVNYFDNLNLPTNCVYRLIIIVLHKTRFTLLNPVFNCKSRLSPDNVSYLVNLDLQKCKTNFTVVNLVLQL